MISRRFYKFIGRSHRWYGPEEDDFNAVARHAKSESLLSLAWSGWRIKPKIPRAVRKRPLYVGKECCCYN